MGDILSGAKVRKFAVEMAGLYQQIAKTDTVCMAKYYSPVGNHFVRFRFPATSIKPPRSWHDVGFPGMSQRKSKMVKDWEKWYYPRLSAVSNIIDSGQFDVSGEVVYSNYAKAVVVGRSNIASSHFEGDPYGIAMAYTVFSGETGAILTVAFSSDEAEILDDFFFALDDLVVETFT